MSWTGSTCTGFEARRPLGSFVPSMGNSTVGPPMRATLSPTSRSPRGGGAGRQGPSCALGPCRARGRADAGRATVSSGPAITAPPLPHGLWACRCPLDADQHRGHTARGVLQVPGRGPDPERAGRLAAWRPQRVPCGRLRARG
eukprot:11101748-Alexandrium_andersonii.AAC.1